MSKSTRSQKSSQSSGDVTVSGVPQTSDGAYGLNGYFAAQGSWANGFGITAAEREYYANVANFYQHQGDLQWQEEQTDLAWSRNSPAAQLQQLMALGISKSQALAMMSTGGATAASAPSGAPTTGEQSPLSELTGVLGTTMSSISGAVAMYQSCKMFGINYQAAKASLYGQQLGNEYQKQMLDGIKLSGDLYGAFDHAKATLGADYKEEEGTKSVDTLIGTIRKAAEAGDDPSQKFLDNVLPVWESSATARNYTASTYQAHMGTKGWNPTEKDQSMVAAKAYAESEQEQLKVDELRSSIDYLVANIDLAEANTRVANAQEAYISGAQTAATNAAAAASRASASLNSAQARAARVDADIREATLADVKQAAIAQAHIDAETLKGIDNQEYYDAKVAEMLDNQDSAMYWASMAKVHASDADAYWKTPEGKAARQQNAFFYDPMFKEALDNIIRQGEAESQVREEGLDLGFVKLMIQKRANRAAFIKETLYPSDPGKKAWNQNWIDATK